MGYASDFGRAERAYYTPTEHAEGEYEGTKTVYCKYDQCAEYEIEHEVDLVIAYVGNAGSGHHTCHRCGLDSDFEFDLDDDEIGGAYDTDEDWRHDK